MSSRDFVREKFFKISFPKDNSCKSRPEMASGEKEIEMTTSAYVMDDMRELEATLSENQIGMQERKLKIMNASLYHNSNEGRFIEIMSMLKDWFYGSNKEAYDYFGFLYLLRHSRESKIDILTITESRKQLRIWHGMPGQPTYNHVDSCGTGLLMSIQGDQSSIDAYSSQILKLGNFGERTTKNSGIVYRYERISKMPTGDDAFIRPVSDYQGACF